MLVSSLIEMYTMLFAWHIYTGFWALLSGTAIAIVPFIIAAISELLEREEDSKTLIKKMEIRLYTMLAVFMLAASPTINLYMQNTKYYQSSCITDVEAWSNGTTTVFEKTFDDSGSKFDEYAAPYIAMLEERTPKTPVWWYVFSRLSQAVSNSLKHELPCKANIGYVATGLGRLSIKDPYLRLELTDFIKDCWLPATNKFMREKPEVPTHFGATILEDVAWPGSRYFIEMPGYYDTWRTKQGLPEDVFPFSALHNDSAVSTGEDGKGWPRCDRWWMDDNFGLRERLVRYVKDNEDQLTIRGWAALEIYDTPAKNDDALLKFVIHNAQKSPADRANITNSLTEFNSIPDFLSTVAALGGTAKEGVFAMAEAQAYKAGAPVVQAFVLMMFVITLPLLLFMSLYDLGTLLTLTAAYFSVVFWTFLFSVAYWLDSFLLVALYGDAWYEALTSTKGSLEMVVITWIVKFSYVGLPLIFSLLMGLAGRNLAVGAEGKMALLMGNIGGGAKKIPSGKIRMPKK